MHTISTYSQCFLHPCEISAGYIQHGGLRTLYNMPETQPKVESPSRVSYRCPYPSNPGSGFMVSINNCVKLGGLDWLLWGFLEHGTCMVSIYENGNKTACLNFWTLHNCNQICTITRWEIGLQMMIYLYLPALLHLREHSTVSLLGISTAIITPH